MPRKSSNQSAAAVHEPTDSVVQDMRALVRDSGALLSSMRENAENRVVHMQDKARNGYRQVQSTALEQLERGSEFVRANPLVALGIAAGVGAILGILLWPGKRRRA